MASLQGIGAAEEATLLHRKRIEKCLHDRSMLTRSAIDRRPRNLWTALREAAELWISPWESTANHRSP
jgi:hypothetical protein